MNREGKLQRATFATAQNREDGKRLWDERTRSHKSAFILSLGEVLDTLLPGGLASGICRTVVRRRSHRRLHSDKS